MAVSKIRGARAMARTLKLLPKAIGEKVLVGALRAGAQVIRKAAIARLGEPGGAKKIVVRKRRRRPGVAASVMVTLTRNAWTLVFREFGAAPHVIRPDAASVLADVETGEFFGAEVAHPGQPARPFLRPAFDLNKQRAVEKIGVQLGRNIERAATRLAGSLAKSGLVRRRRRRR